MRSDEDAMFPSGSRNDGRLDLEAEALTIGRAIEAVRTVRLEARLRHDRATGVAAAIPARDEAERIAATLHAVRDALEPDDVVVLVANGSRDATAALALDALRAGPQDFILAVVEWRPGAGTAPLARRIAMDLAAALRPAGWIGSLDADGRPMPGWRAAYEAEFAAGFDLVCGAIGFDPREAALLPPEDPESEALLRDYRAASRELEALRCPDPDNPWPHHGNIGGANFAIRAEAYARIGGLPVPPSGEDRALLRRARAEGLRIRHAEAPLVETSCRLDGRARGGLSDELARARREPDPLVDEALEPAARLCLRLGARAAFLVAATGEGRRAALAPLGLRSGDLEMVLATAGREAAWQRAEEASPALRRTRLRRSDLRREWPALKRALLDARAVAGDPGDSPRDASPPPAANPASRR